MESSPCFIPATTSVIRHPISNFQPGRFCSRTSQCRWTRRRNTATRIIAVHDSSPSEHVAASTEIISDTDVSPISSPESDTDMSPIASPESDRKAFDSLTSSGESSLREIGAAVSDQLESVSDKTQAFADNTSADQTEALLARYDEQQRELLANIDEERRVIEAELTSLSKWADSLSKRQLNEGGTSSRGKLLAAVAGIFSIAALVYAFTAVVDQDSGAFANASVDAIVATAAAFFFTREQNAGHDVRNK